MAAVQPLKNAGSAFVKVEVDFTSNWNAASPSYTDVTGDVRFADGVVWERGRNDEFQTVSAGSCQFTLNNRTRTYDPITNANMVPARPARITCYYPTTGTAYQQIQMQVEDWVPDWTVDKDAVVKANCIESFGALTFTRIASSAYISTTAVARLTDLANAAGWPAGPRSFVAGSQLLTAGQLYQGVDVLSAMQDVANGQAQVLYQDRTGVLTTHAMFTATATSGGTFGDGAGELPFYTPDGGVGGGYWYTQVQLTAATGPAGPWTQNQPNTVTANVGSNYTTGKYGTRVFARNTAATTQAAAQTVAASIASSLNGLNPYRLKQIVIRPLANPSVLFPVVLAADFGVPYTFNFQPPGGGSRISITAKLRSIRHEITEKDWVVTWMMSP
jgi:hypothetical protein